MLGRWCFPMFGVITFAADVLNSLRREILERDRGVNIERFLQNKVVLPRIEPNRTESPTFTRGCGEIRERGRESLDTVLREEAGGIASSRSHVTTRRNPTTTLVAFLWECPGVARQLRKQLVGTVQSLGKLSV